MHHLADLLSTIPLPELPEDDASPGAAGARGGTRVVTLRDDLAACCGDDASLVHDLGADLPAGHLHVWGGPSGAGKTAFLLCLLQSAAARGRRVVYATYELAPERLALRLLARTAGVDLAALPDPGSDADGAGDASAGERGADCTLDPATLRRVHAARERLASLPFDILPARGFNARSLHDRLVRMPFRAEVLAIDYLQAVVRDAEEPMGACLQTLSTLADHLHVAVVCAVRAADTAGGGLAAPELEDLGIGRSVDRVGWLTPGGAGARQAHVLRNRHGDAPSVPLRLDGATGSFRRDDVAARDQAGRPNTVT